MCYNNSIMIYERNCNNCGKQYRGNGKKYCGRKCFNESKKTIQLRQKRMKNNKLALGSPRTVEGRERRRKTLLKKWEDPIFRAKMLINKPRTLQISLTDDPVGFEKIKKPIYIKKEVSCLICNKLFLARNKYQILCPSKECKEKRKSQYYRNLYVKKDPSLWSKKTTLKGVPRYDMRGKNHPNWKGGKTKEALLIKDRIEYKEWQRSVFRRDLWTCQKCNKKSKKLACHHIYNFATYPELRFEISNGVTFCDVCHNRFHKIYTCHNNTWDQLNEYQLDVT